MTADLTCACAVCLTSVDSPLPDVPPDSLRMLSNKHKKEYAARRKALMETIGRRGVAIVPAASEVVRARDTHYRFRQNSDFQYLTGFPEPDAIAVLVPGRRDEGHRSEFILFVRPRDEQREIWDGRRAGPEGAVRDYMADEAHSIEDFDEVLSELLADRDTLHYSLGEFPDLDRRIAQTLRVMREVSRRGAAAPVNVTALDLSLHEMRLIKRPAEIELIRHACEVSARAHVRAMRATAPGRNEWQIAAEVHAEFELAGLQPGYGTICAGGANACILHYTENNRPLRDGDLLLLDAGGEFQGYTGDITRSFPVNGRFSEAQREIYALVLKANREAIATLKPGTSVGKPNKVAVRVLTEGLVELGLLQGEVDELIKAGAQRRFYMHGTGHWLGMDVHDVGRYRIDGEFRKFVPGMVMTVEPGLYIAPGSEGVDPRFWGIGVRIEDDVLVTEHGPEVLTAAVPKDIDAIEALMAGAPSPQ